MKLLPTLVLAATVIASPAMASYTECTVSKDTELAIMPNGPTEPRLSPVAKGDKVAFRNKHGDWWFVLHWVGDSPEYGWLPRSILSDCQAREGTP